MKTQILSTVASDMNLSVNWYQAARIVEEIQCVRKVAVHLDYGRVQLKCDGTR